MSIWILALLLLASLAGLGYRQGVIRVGFSLVGILFGALLAVPLGHLVRPLFSLCGLKHPVLLWLVPPVVMFAIVLTIFKVAALVVHRKIEVHYKYQEGLRLALWERFSRRVGLCLGLLNGLAYLVLLSFVIYVFSYWTVQMASADSDPRGVRLLNSLGKDLESTGMSKVARAIDRMPATYYDTADVIGLVYHNPTPGFETRFALYPAFLSLGEKPEFQDLGKDPGFAELRNKPASLIELFQYEKTKAIVNNPEMLKTIWAAAGTNLQDLATFLQTGESPKFGDEKILGRWTFDLNGAMALYLRANPDTTPSKKVLARRRLAMAFRNTTFVATHLQEAFLKDVPPIRGPGAAAASVQYQTLQGRWTNADGKYELTFTVDGQPEQVRVEIQNDRLAIPLAGTPLAFVRVN